MYMLWICHVIFPTHPMSETPASQIRMASQSSAWTSGETNLFSRGLAARFPNWKCFVSISYYIILYVMFHYVIFYHILFYYIIWYYITLCNIMSCFVMLHHMKSYTILYYIMLYHILSYHIISSHIKTY